jgi:acetone carboxylase gamma subunit
VLQNRIAPAKKIAAPVLNPFLNIVQNANISTKSCGSGYRKKKYSASLKLSKNWFGL